MSTPTSRNEQEAPQRTPAEPGQHQGLETRYQRPAEESRTPAPAPSPRRAPRGGTLPSWAPFAAFGAAAAVMAVVSAVIGFDAVRFLLGTVLLGGLAFYAWSRRLEGPRRATDRGVTVIVTAAFALAVAPLLSLTWTVVSRGIERMDVEFLGSSMRGIISEGGGAFHGIVGTLIITGLATLASVPIGILAAIYLVEYGRGRLKRALTFFVDVMTGIPSIVAGLFAYALFALFLGPGIRLGVIGAVALSVLMIPIVVRTTEEMLRIVPNHLREASYALGVPKWRTIVKVVLPTALAGIVTGVMLSVARVVGETAPLLITTGVISSMNYNPFDGRMQNLPVFAYNEYRSPGVPPEPSFDRAWAAALTLIIIVMALNVAARFVYRRFGTELR